MKKTLFILFLLVLSISNLYAQNTPEYYFKFNINDKSELDTITQLISIDNVKGLEVYAYALQHELDEFKNLGYKIEYIQKDTPKAYTMATTVSEMTNWDRYPTYEVYRQMMKNFESNYPSLCKLDSIGETNNGRQLYVLKISDNVNSEESEPDFFYTSSMHGDEITGFILMLRLADSLLSTYGTSTQVTTLVNEVEIYINPSANPDGTYYGGNNTVSSAIRSNGVADLNRDYPDPRTGANSPYQPETQAMMDFAEEHHFVMSANFHGGAEVLNYPWDTWYTSENLHADTDWFEHICTDYVTTARTVKSTYMTDTYSDGVTHGATWYKVAGGRQDYMNYWQQCREVTMEISTAKTLAVENLNNYWNYNKQSLLNYINECLYGIRGTVKSKEGFPLKAMITIIDHDETNDSSMVFTDSNNGDYHRLIEAGTYDVAAAADGYISDTIKDVSVNWDDVTWVNFKLVSKNDSIELITNAEIYDTLFFDQTNANNIIIANDSNALSTNYTIEIENLPTNNWLSINKNSGNLYGTENDTVVATLNTEQLSAGNYSAFVFLTAEDFEVDTITVNLFVKDTISTYIEPQQVIDTLWGGNSSQYKISLKNSGLALLNYTIQIDNQASNGWISTDKNSGSLAITEVDTVIATVATKDFGFGNFNCDLIIEKENSTNDTISFMLFVKDTISSEINLLYITDTLNQDTSKNYSLYIKNTGYSLLEYSITIDYPTKSDSWISLDQNSGSVVSGQEDTITITINTTDLHADDYACMLTISDNGGDNYSIPVDIHVDQTQAIQDFLELENVNIYPNPFSDEIIIKFNYLSNTPIILSLISIDGSVLYTEKTQVQKGGNVITFDNSQITNLPKGIYLIQMSTSNNKVVKKLIKN